MFSRCLLAGLLPALFAGATACAHAQATAVETPGAAPAAAAAPAPVVPEEFTLSAPMAGPSVPVITAPGAAPAATPSTQPAAVQPAPAQPAAAQHFESSSMPAQPAAAPASSSAAAAAASSAAPAAPSGAAEPAAPAQAAAAPTSADPLGALISGLAAPVKLAFLLPEADSPFEGPSQEVLQGVLAANYASASPIEVLLVRPGAGESIAGMVRRAAMAGAMAAIGPLDRSKLAELAELDYLPLPVVALNQIDLDTAVALSPEEIAQKRQQLEARRASEQHLRDLIIAETNEALGESSGQQDKSGGIKTRSTVPGLVFAEELAVSTVRYEPVAFPRGLLMLGLSMEDDAARVARLGLAALPPTTSKGTRPKVLLLDYDKPLEKRVSAAFEHTLVAAGYAPDRLTVDLSQFQRVSKFFDLAIERLDASEFNEALIDQEADPVGWRQQQIRIRRLKAAKRARAALAEPPYHAVFLAMDAKTASLIRSRLPMRSRIWGAPMINPGDPRNDPQAQAMTYDLLQVAFVDSPLVLDFDAEEFEDLYRVPAPQTTVQKRLFALGADAFEAALSIAHGTSSASFDGLLGTIAYNLTLSPKAERRGQTAMIFGGELRVMNENDVVDFESVKTNSRRMRAQARSYERLHREAQRAAREAGTLIDESSGAAPAESFDNYNFSGGDAASDTQAGDSAEAGAAAPEASAAALP